MSVSLTKVDRATPADAGCWIDGHWGQYGSTRLIDIASSLGMVLTSEEEKSVQAYEAGESVYESSVYGTVDVVEWVLGQGELADMAERWLNDHVAPEGYTFGWHDGEFFLWSTEEWEEESY